MAPSVTPRLANPSAAAVTLLGDPSDGAPTLVDGGRPRPARTYALERGAMLGRYIVLETLGRGGMGIVYAAYDPELDRKVALKLLLPGYDRGASARARLLREAQAIARLSHPNVVAVHDVGTVGEQVFIAMELVEGMDLGRWLTAERRSYVEILGVFLQAGAGLAAAHAADMAHRDFKPENVLVGRDGRARVVDFGLVRKDETLSSRPGLSVEELPVEVSQHRAALDDDALRTAAGVLVGTPAYMSPEQFHGLGGDARSDQFSYCVSLYEALYGERPFAGESLTELAYAVTHAEIRAAPSQPAVPGRLRQVLLRGLALEPQQRYASMEALMAAIRKAATPRRGRWIAGGLVALSGGVGLLVLGVQEQACAHASDRAAQVWSPERQEALRERFTQTGRSYAADTWERVQAHLDGYTGEWAAQAQTVCEASQGGAPAVAAEDPRQRCLDERLDALDDLLTIFAEAETKTVTHAVSLVHGLGAPADCADDDRTALPHPSEPALREQVDELRAELRRMELVSNAGIHALDADELGVLAERATALGFEPFMAEVRDVQSGLAADRGDYDRAVDLANLAFETALASRHDQRALRVAAQLVFLHGVTRREPIEAHQWGRRAEALGQRLGSDPQQRARLLANWASVYALAGDDAQARAFQDEALGIMRELDEPENLAAMLNNTGAFHATRGQYEEARPYFEEARLQQVQLLGPDHPNTLRTEANLGIVAIMAGRYAEGRIVLEAVLPRQEASLGADHAEVANTLESLAVTLTRAGELEASERTRRRVLEIRLRAYGPATQPVLSAKSNLVSLLSVADRDAEAYALGVELMRELDMAKGVDPSTRIIALGNFAIAALDLERAQEALSRAEEALALCRSTECAEPQALGAMSSIGRSKLALGDRAGARALFESILVRSEANSSEAARARFDLARVMLLDDRTAALAAARQALDETQAMEADVHSRKLVRAIEAWLREHG
jgi:eukaryotic-like serine/threonine-protein kinase